MPMEPIGRNPVERKNFAYSHRFIIDVWQRREHYNPEGRRTPQILQNPLEYC